MADPNIISMPRLNIPQIKAGAAISAASTGGESRQPITITSAVSKSESLAFGSLSGNGLTQRQPIALAEEEAEHNGRHTNQDAVLHAYSIQLNDGNERMLQWFDSFSFYTQIFSDILLVWDVAAAVIAFKMLPPRTMGGWDGSQYVRGKPLAVLGAVAFALLEAVLIMFSFMIHVIRAVAKRFSIGNTTSMDAMESQTTQRQLREQRATVYNRYSWRETIRKSWRRWINRKRKNPAHIPVTGENEDDDYIDDGDFTLISPNAVKNTRSEPGKLAAGAISSGSEPTTTSSTDPNPIIGDATDGRIPAVIPTVIRSHGRRSKIRIDVGSPSWGMFTYTFNLIIWAYTGMVTAFMISSVVTE
jgi:hypothetical protein